MSRSFVQRGLGAVARRSAGCVFCVFCVFAAGVLLALRAEAAGAQSIGDQAAWAALMLSPVGALPPLAHDGVIPTSAGTEFTVRYGRWRYDEDDAIHNDFGLTMSRELGVARTRIAITAAYLSSSCGTCGGSISGGIEMQRRLLQRTLAGDSADGTTASAGVRASVGGARSMDETHSVASSLAGAAALGVSRSFVWSSRLSLTILPGAGVGRLSSADESASGIRPSLGASLTWALHSGVVMDVGMQKIFIDQGPTQLGLGLTWVHP